jgi:hypothetical protein
MRWGPIQIWGPGVHVVHALSPPVHRPIAGAVYTLIPTCDASAKTANGVRTRRLPRPAADVGRMCSRGGGTLRAAAARLPQAHRCSSCCRITYEDMDSLVYDWYAE